MSKNTFLSLYPIGVEISVTVHTINELIISQKTTFFKEGITELISIPIIYPYPAKSNGPFKNVSTYHQVVPLTHKNPNMFWRSLLAVLIVEYIDKQSENQTLYHCNLRKNVYKST